MNAETTAKIDWKRSYYAEAGKSDALRKELVALREDAERYRHCKAHGHPMTGPQCLAWTYDGRMVFGATPEEALDNAIAHRV